MNKVFSFYSTLDANLSFAYKFDLQIRLLTFSNDGSACFQNTDYNK